MHRTSTTHLSDAIERVVDLDTQLNDVKWMPIEQQVHLCVMGSVVMQGILDGTKPEEFTTEEFKLIEDVIERLNSIAENMMLDSNSDSDWNC